MGFVVNKDPVKVPFKVSMGSFEYKSTRHVGGRWPGGVVKVYVDPELDGDKVAVFWATAKRWCDFINNAAQRIVIKFIEVDKWEKGTASLKLDYSQADIGYLPGRQAKTGVDYDNQLGSLPHELGHTMGLAHEQIRPDKQEWLKEELKRLNKTMSKSVQENHNTQLGFAAGLVGHGEMDKYSIMMYPDVQTLLGVEDTNTSQGGEAITPAQVEAKSWYPSQGDIDTLAWLYSL